MKRTEAGNEKVEETPTKVERRGNVHGHVRSGRESEDEN